MNDIRIEIVKDIQAVDQHVYTAAIDSYISMIKQNASVKAVYQMGSVKNPGISDIDLIVVVENAADPVSLRRISINHSGLPQGYRGLFIHDVYLHDTTTFKDLVYITYCDNLKQLYGEALPCHEAGATDEQILALHYIFDFIASRLAQFTSFLMSRKISYRGLLVRVASIKHSYWLLNKLDIYDKDLESYIARIDRCRRDHDKITQNEALQLFLDAFYYFNLIVEHAALFFQENHLTFFTPVDSANSLKLNPNFSVKFTDDAKSLYRSPRLENQIYYPSPVFYHYIAYTQTKTPFGDAAKWRLSCSGDELFMLSASYMNTLERRLSAMTRHLQFLMAAKAGFAMKGNAGFVADDIGESLDSDGYRFGAPIPDQHKSITADGDFSSIDRVAKPIHFEALHRARPCEVEKRHFDKAFYKDWVNTFFPEWPRRYRQLEHKKLIEMFVSFQILQPAADDTYLDAAGGRNAYADRVNCKQKYLHVYQLNRSLIHQYGNKVDFIEGDAANIGLDDASISKISCHHSFEHFQDQSDIQFIKEVQRLLAPGGKCCIVPLFLATAYIEVTQTQAAQRHFDPQATYVVDPRARITGGQSCGDYARIYSLAAFKNRIVSQLDRSAFDLKISEIFIGSRNVPDLSLDCHRGITKINFPYRALTLTRKNGKSGLGADWSSSGPEMGEGQ